MPSSFPYAKDDRVVTPDGPGTVIRTWEPTIRGARGCVRQELADVHPDCEAGVPYWAMSMLVELDNGRTNAYHALRVRRDLSHG